MKIFQDTVGSFTCSCVPGYVLKNMNQGIFCTIQKNQRKFKAYQKLHLNCENRLKSKNIHIEDKHPTNNIQKLIIVTDFIMLIILVLINLIFRYSLEKASKCKAINDPPDEPVKDPSIEFIIIIFNTNIIITNVINLLVTKIIIIIIYL